MNSFRRQVAHNHVNDRWRYRLWPAMQVVLDDPEFLALDRQVDEALARQRETIEAMAVEMNAGH